MYPFQVKPPRIQQYREYPPGRFHRNRVLSLASEIVSPMYKKKLYGQEHYYRLPGSDHNSPNETMKGYCFSTNVPSAPRNATIPSLKHLCRLVILIKRFILLLVP